MDELLGQLVDAFEGGLIVVAAGDAPRGVELLLLGGGFSCGVAVLSNCANQFSDGPNRCTNCRAFNSTKWSQIKRLGRTAQPGNIRKAAC